MSEWTYQPKGGMCRTCESRDKDCSHLRFITMPIIGRDLMTMTKIVKCTSHASTKHPESTTPDKA